jgi:tRNA-2-methylthio-N6-dimethylallyladenosine synthase
MVGKFFIKTYGCQMNELDGQQMERLLQARGMHSVSEAEQADLILINTCSIREKASQKVYSDVGRFRSLKMQRPDVVLGVTGCQAEAEGAHLLKRFPYLDLVIGPDHTAKVPDLVDSLLKDRKGRSAQVGFTQADDYQFLNLLPDEDENAAKAFITIMKGCDNFCSFCIVPYVRGREVCREPEEIIAEAVELGRRGVKEVTLLGQNVNSYGVGRHSEAARNKKGKSPFIPFSELLHRVAEATGIERIRFTTSHPKDMPDDLIDEFARNEKLARHFHLPVQSGSDAVLSRMYRGYTRDFCLDRLARLRSVDPEIALSTDIIVGFPGETEEDFQATLNLLKEVRFDSIYSFVYSPRPKTTAALYFEDDIPLPLKQERLRRAQDLQDEITYEKNLTWVGRMTQVLVEGPSKLGGSLCGRSSQNHVVHLEAGAGYIGKIFPVRITHAGRNCLRGVVDG